MLQVFEINDVEWWAGDCSPEAILAAYIKETGCSHEEATGDLADYPKPLGDSDLDVAFFQNTNDDGDCIEGRISFRARLSELVAEGTKFPCFFATSDY